MVGDDALVDYPHPRHACAVFKFETTSHLVHCPNCWYDANGASPLSIVSSRAPRGLLVCPVIETVASPGRGENHRAAVVAERTASRAPFLRQTLTCPVPGRVYVQVLLLRRAGAVP